MRRVSNGLLCTVSTINFLPEGEKNFYSLLFSSDRSLKLQIQKKIESSRQQLNPSSLTVECMNKIINLQKSPDISPEEIGIPRPSGETPPPGRGPTRVRGWWLVPPRFKFIYICIPCACCALWTTRRRYWFRPRSQSRTPLSKRVTSLQRPAKSAPPRKFAVTQIHRFALSIPTRLMCEEWRSNFVCFSFLSGEEHGYIQFDGKRIKVGICEEWRKQVW